MHSDKLTKTAEVRRLNDRLRTTLQGGRIVVTSGVDALGPERLQRLLVRLRAFDEFDEANDPYSEHDFGGFDHEGEEFLWKIDYYDASLTFHSDDPADPAKTVRVLTLMLAHEY